MIVDSGKTQTNIIMEFAGDTLPERITYFLRSRVPAGAVNGKEPKMTAKKPKPYKELTPKQQRFVDSYDGDIRRSSTIAGISYGYAKQLMCLEKHASVQAAIENRKLTESNRLVKTRQERQEFWSDMMEDAEKDSDKLKASELLGRSEADFTDNIRGGIGSLDDLSKLTDQELKDAENDLDG